MICAFSPVFSGRVKWHLLPEHITLSSDFKHPFRVNPVRLLGQPVQTPEMQKAPQQMPSNTCDSAAASHWRLRWYLIRFSLKCYYCSNDSRSHGIVVLAALTPRAPLRDNAQIPHVMKLRITDSSSVDLIASVASGRWYYFSIQGGVISRLAQSHHYLLYRTSNLTGVLTVGSCSSRWHFQLRK